MEVSDNTPDKSSRLRGIRPETEEKYRWAIGLYRSTRMSCAEISRVCKVTVSGFQRCLSLYHRDLLLARYDITCSREEARQIKLGPLRGQLPATRARYKDAVEACGNLDYIELNVSQIARRFGLDDCSPEQFIRWHFPETVAKHRQLVRLTEKTD